MRLVYRINDVDDFSDELEDLAIKSALKIYNLYLEFFSNVDTFLWTFDTNANVAGLTES